MSCRVFLLMLLVAVSLQKDLQDGQQSSTDDVADQLYAGRLQDELDRFLVVGVKYYAPWCSTCKKWGIEWEKTRHLLDQHARQNILLLNVDATDPANRAESIRAGVGSYPTIKVFTKGGPPSGVKYVGRRVASEITDFLVTAASHSLHMNVKPTETESMLVRVLAYISESDGKTIVDVLNTTASSATGVMDFFSFTDLASFRSSLREATGSHLEHTLQESTSCVAVVSFVDDINPVHFADREALSSVSAFRSFLDRKTLVPVKEIRTFRGRDGVYLDRFAGKIGMGSSGDKLLLLSDEETFTPQARKALQEAVEEESRNNADKLHTIWVPRSFPEVSTLFSAANVIRPCLVFENDEGMRFGETMLPYSSTKEQEAVLLKAALLHFIAEARSGLLAPLFNSEERIADLSVAIASVDSTKWVFSVPRVQFEDTLHRDAGENIVLLVYTPWCRFSQYFMPVYYNLAASYRALHTKAGRSPTSQTILFTRFDASKNDLPVELRRVVPGYPCLLLWTTALKQKQKWHDPIVYEGNRSSADISTNFLQKKITSMDEHGTVEDWSMFVDASLLSNEIPKPPATTVLSVLHDIWIGLTVPAHIPVPFAGVVLKTSVGMLLVVAAVGIPGTVFGLVSAYDAVHSFFSRRTYYPLIFELYQKHNPKLLDDRGRFETILKTYRGREHLLYRKVLYKYERKGETKKER
ncbi:Protein disulfide-isomerase [Diplonema papillatum]|nr:Protein disulfide-isomerase [Diplonema papillatum]